MTPPVPPEQRDQLAEAERLVRIMAADHTGTKAGRALERLLAALDSLRTRNTTQGLALALAQAQHDVEHLRAHRALVLEWCASADTPVRYGEHVRTLLGGE